MVVISRCTEPYAATRPSARRWSKYDALPPRVLTRPRRSLPGRGSYRKHSETAAAYKGTRARIARLPNPQKVLKALGLMSAAVLRFHAGSIVGSDLPWTFTLIHSSALLWVSSRPSSGRQRAALKEHRAGWSPRRSRVQRTTPSHDVDLVEEPQRKDGGHQSPDVSGRLSAQVSTKVHNRRLKSTGCG